MIASSGQSSPAWRRGGKGERPEDADQHFRVPGSLSLKARTSPSQYAPCVGTRTRNQGQANHPTADPLDYSEPIDRPCCLPRFPPRIVKQARLVAREARFGRNISRLSPAQISTTIGAVQLVRILLRAASGALPIANWGEGAVTRTEFGRSQFGSPSFGSGRGGGSPRLERFFSEDAERAAGGEMALDVEGVLDSGVNGQEALG